MNKTSALFFALGILVLILAGYFALRSNTVSGPEVNQVSSEVAEENIKAVFIYEKDHPVESKAVRAREGQTVVIKVTSEVADEVHLHGYDLSVDVEPGIEARLEFIATKTGRFTIELEKLHHELGVIEVYPQ